MASDSGSGRDFRFLMVLVVAVVLLVATVVLVLSLEDTVQAIVSCLSSPGASANITVEEITITYGDISGNGTVSVRSLDARVSSRLVDVLLGALTGG